MSTPSMSMSASRSTGSAYPGRPWAGCTWARPDMFAFAAFPPSISVIACINAAS